MAAGNKWVGKTGGGNFGQKFLIALFGFVKVSFIYPILLPVIPFYLLFAGKGRHAIWIYFRKILCYKPLRAAWATFANHLIFGKVVLDKFAFAAGRAGIFQIETQGEETFNKALDDSRGCIIAGAHIGNLEICGHLLKQDKKRVHALIYGGENEALQRKRSESFGNLDLIPVKDDMSHSFAIIKALMDGDIVTVACDRMYGEERAVSVDFMGHQANFPLGMFLIAAKMNIPVFAVTAVKEGGLRYKGFVYKLEAETEGKPAQRAEQLAQSFAASLEAVLTRYPRQWFNYYDFWNIEN